LPDEDEHRDALVARMLVDGLQDGREDLGLGVLLALAECHVCLAPGMAN
jgi:hypothetical protein